MKRFFISTPIYYVNARPHLGHAYTTIIADSLTRFHRALGEETFFLTGTDEHGDKIVEAARAAGSEPREYADRISAAFRDLWPRLGIEYSDFIRTTEERHKACVRDILMRVYEAGDIYFGEYGGHYCFGCERFYTEKELKDGLCPDHGTRPEYIQEKNYFFRMSRYQDWLISHIEANPDFIRPARYKTEVLSLLQSGVLEDLCISRPKTRLAWGVELPFDENYVTYVWFDALINYISALDPGSPNFEKFWPVANHLVAKDILKPHGVFWPTMLKAAGMEPYRHLNVHGYWLLRDAKMSKTVGNVVDPLGLVEKYGLDAFRYFLLREMHFGNDALFSEDAFVARLNADLANDLGNLFSRVLSMARKYFGGKVPAEAALAAEDLEVISLGREAIKNFERLFMGLEFSTALESLWELVRGLNKYVDSMAPWTLFKARDMERLGTVMYVLLEHMRKLGVCLWPVMPGASMRMLSQLGISFDPDAANLGQEAGSWGGLEPGLDLAESSRLFPRVEAPRTDPDSRQ